MSALGSKVDLVNVIDKIIELTGKTLKGKNVIRNRGKLWVIKDERFASCMGALSFLIRPLKDEESDFRWVKQVNDDNFEIKEVT